MARKKKYTYEVVDLFCGIGGLSYGLKCQGMKILAGFDLDWTCKYAYETNTGGTFHYRDVKTIKGEEIKKLYSKKKNVIRVLAGCAPCQPFSSYAFKDLGANGREVFSKVILPLSMPGIYSGIIMVFMPTVSTFAIAELLTRNKITLFGSLIQRAFGEGGLTMWNYGAALSLIMLLIIGLTSFFGEKEESGTATVI